MLVSFSLINRFKDAELITVVGKEQAGAVGDPGAQFVELLAFWPVWRIPRQEAAKGPADARMMCFPAGRTRMWLLLLLVYQRFYRYDAGKKAGRERVLPVEAPKVQPIAGPQECFLVGIGSA
jgi:hypothetical protein